MKRRRNPSEADESEIRILVEDAVSDLKLSLAESIGLYETMSSLRQKNRQRIDIDLVMAAFNKITGGRGVEALHDRNSYRRFWEDVVLLYVNLGDPYEKTILYDVDDGKLLRRSWGNWMESYEMSHDADIA